ncbi:N-acetylneuraminate synthase [Helicobacter heilmannii]|uniref:Pseudaminic acid synthase n=1 Tax=Helicobacter heilmannii TaxID=35817 RepID=A0A0K2XSA2_HELHE|nr:pseudaminic acid synthase [Helicobacter heilmannii]BDQ27346.1 pseudaminic acid synthase [Helicobacter heilmannii]CCM12290.2 N-acetylneuraminate synthase [Helicobacter heilmannii ASB1.4]CRF48987.1 N-acetylneuraminate synthase [Helicobacter heilmannii]CRI34082.1 N-acetylneuraminate synthase [Helicobacter heilmannii]
MTPLLVAELSANHGHSLDTAQKSLIVLKNMGVGAAKLQTYTPDCLTLPINKPPFIIEGTLWDQQSLYALYQEAAMPLEWHKPLFELAKSLDLCLFSSVFSLKGLELLESLDCPLYKIASFEITDLELLRLVASTKKPLIISTGIATHENILDALEVCHKADNTDITLLKCTSAYPAPLKDANLLTMPKLKELYHTPYGLSDHTLGNTSAIIATSLGASVIEKHFMLDKSLRTPDRAFSLDTKEFSALVQAVRETTEALGCANPTTKEIKGAQFARSLFVIKPLKKGETLTKEHIKALRPNAGLAPKFLEQILGQKATRDLEVGHPLSWQDLLRPLG